MTKAREAGDQRLEGDALTNLGTVYVKLGDKEQARALWSEARHTFQAIGDPRAEDAIRWLNNLDALPQSEAKQSIYVQKMVLDVIEAARTGDSKANTYFDAISRIIRDLDVAPEIQELARVLQKILVGIKEPDLSHLSEELAALVKEKLQQ